MPHIYKVELRLESEHRLTQQEEIILKAELRNAVHKVDYSWVGLETTGLTLTRTEDTGR